MNAMIMGYRPVSYQRRGTNEQVDGLSLYVASENSETYGLMTDDVWIDKLRNPKLYSLVSGLDVTEPIPAELVYEVQLGGRKPVLVAINLTAQ